MALKHPNVKSIYKKLLILFVYKGDLDIATGLFVFTRAVSNKNF